ncbi:MAG: hypothetical protein HY925_06235, partial [Elusimicrobia bacterium]|nr:hypothetical protein [Elusimicrobiota bacterium]
MRTSIWTAALLFGLAAEATAAAPQTIGYQGFLRESGGLAVGNKTMVFKIYPSSDVAAVAVYNSGNMTVTVSTGIFHVSLDVTGVNFESANAWLEITVNGTVLSPREQLTSGPYAINSLYHAGKRYISSGTTPSGTVAPGDLWFDTAGNVLYYRTGAPAWQALSAAGLTTHAATHAGAGTDPVTSLGAVTFTANQTLASGIAIGSAGDGVRLSSHVLVTVGRTGLNTTTPRATLDVAGEAMFGTTATSSFSIVGGLFMAHNSSITLAGAQGWILSRSSITASGFFGDGSGLTNVSGVTAGTIDSSKLAKASVDSEKLVNLSIDRNHLRSASVDPGKIADDSIVGAKILNQTIDSIKLSAGAADTNALGSGAVTINKILGGAVDTNALGSGAVTINKIRAGAVDTNALGSGSVTSNKILAGAVDTNAIGSGSIT